MGLKTGQPILIDDVVFGHTVYTGQYSINSALNFSSDCPALFFGSGTSIILVLFKEGLQLEQTYTITSAWAAAQQVGGAAIIGDYFYILLIDGVPDPDEFRLYRFAKNNLAAGGTLMTFSGATVLTNANLATDLRIATDGTSIYFNFNAGNDTTNDYKIAKFSISGTVCTYVSTTNLGSTTTVAARFAVRSTGEYIGLKSSDGTIRRFNSSGTLQATSIAHVVTNLAGLAHIIDTLVYLAYSTTNIMVRVPIA